MTTALAPAPSAWPLRPASRGRWAAALAVGAALWLAATVASQFVPQVVLGLTLSGPTFALVGAIQLLLGPAAVAGALRIAGLRLRDVGLTSAHWRRDALVGAGVAVAFAIAQFLVVIPLTGGAARSDVAANRAQIGDSVRGVAGVVALAWAGGFSEELFFRGQLVTTLRRLLGDSRAGLAAATAVTAACFAAMHGYQGWAGVVDTGLYGGITLTLLYLWRRRLTACVVAHALWNTLAAVALYLWY